MTKNTGVATISASDSLSSYSCFSKQLGITATIYFFVGNFLYVLFLFPLNISILTWGYDKTKQNKTNAVGLTRNCTRDREHWFNPDSEPVSAGAQNICYYFHKDVRIWASFGARFVIATLLSIFCIRRLFLFLPSFKLYNKTCMSRTVLFMICTSNHHGWWRVV